MKINLIIILRCLIFGSKRKYDEAEVSEINSYSKQYSRELLYDNFIRNPFNSSTSSVSFQNDSFSYLGKYSDSSCDLNELLKSLGDDVTYLERINEEIKNNVTGKVIGDNSQKPLEEKEVFNLEQLDKFVSKKFDDFSIDCPKSVYEKNILNKNKKNNTFAKIRNRNFCRLNLISSKKQTLKTYIEGFILSYISKSYASNYERKFNIITEVCEVFDKYKVKNDNYIFPFEYEYFKIILNELKHIFFGFDKNLSFNNETYDLFSVKFGEKIYPPIDSGSFLCTMNNLSHERKIILFYGELMKLYKYVDDIPEILTLGGLFNDFTFPDVILILHLINLFAEDVKNVKNHRVFILFMITRAVKYFYIHYYNPFDPPRHEISCDKSYHDLYFFLWEFNSTKRHDMKRRKMNPFQSEPSDYVHLKINLLIYFYQHNIFFKYYDIIGEEHIFEFEKFIDNVIDHNECIACFLNEYLSRIKNYLQVGIKK